MVIGRFAPTPSGRMHIGNVYAMLGAWLSARAGGPERTSRTGGGAGDADCLNNVNRVDGMSGAADPGDADGGRGRMLLRIEDIDTPRVLPDADRWIMDDLAWLGLDWDGEPVYQSRRLDIYEQALRALQGIDLRDAAAFGGRDGVDGTETTALIYPCFCSRADIRAASAPQEGDRFVMYPGTGRRALAERERSLDMGTLRKHGVTAHQVIGYCAWLLGLQQEPEPCAAADLLHGFSWDALAADSQDRSIPDDPFSIGL